MKERMTSSRDIRPSRQSSYLWRPSTRHFFSLHSLVFSSPLIAGYWLTVNTGQNHHRRCHPSHLQRIQELQRYLVVRSCLPVDVLRGPTSRGEDIRMFAIQPHRKLPELIRAERPSTPQNGHSSFASPYSRLDRWYVPLLLHL